MTLPISALLALALASPMAFASSDVNDPGPAMEIAQSDDGLLRRRRGAPPPPPPAEPQESPASTDPTEPESPPGAERAQPAAAPAAPPRPIERVRPTVRTSQPPVAPAPRRSVVPTPKRPAVSEPIHQSPSDEPKMDRRARAAPLAREAFRPDPAYADTAYDADAQLAIYGGKHAVSTPRPLIELGYPMYSGGPIGAGSTLLGRKNLLRPQFLVYGDWRLAVGNNSAGDEAEFNQAATRLNLDMDLKLTATERLHALFRPLEDDGEFTRVTFGITDDAGNDGEDIEEAEFSAEPVTLFFEGDLGAIWAGFTDRYNGLDLPFSIGRIPLLVQNGVWLDDAFDGLAFAIPAMNSPKLDISNMDIAVYLGLNDISTGAIPDSEDEAKLVAIAAFIERRGSYWEFDYGYVIDDSDGPVDHSYHNLSAAWTRRFGAMLSHSTRVIANFGQQSPGAGGDKLADGALLLLENSLITSRPSTFVPYFNLFYGIDSPQPLAKNAGGVLKNTGLSFEADALTGFGSLGANARNAYGGAVGLQYLFNLNRQIVVELAGQSRHGDDKDLDEEFAFGARFQQPFGRQFIFRADLIVGQAVPVGGIEAQDITGARIELRAKF